MKAMEGERLILASKGLVENHSAFLLGIKDSQFYELCWSHGSDMQSISRYSPADFSLTASTDLCPQRGASVPGAGARDSKCSSYGGFLLS